MKDQANVTDDAFDVWHSISTFITYLLAVLIASILAYFILMLFR